MRSHACSSSHSIHRSAVAIAFFTLAGSDFAAQVKQPAPPPVRQVDHVMIRTGDPGKLYAFFTEVLQLPVAWPLATRGGVTSGGVGFGNVNVEAIQFPGKVDKASQPQLVGFGFEPSPLRECLAELDRRGITYGPQRATVSTGQDLGVDSLKEIVVGVRDLEAARTLWQKLLNPTPSSASYAWQIGSGPTIHLVRAEKNLVQTLVVRVTSLQRAKAFLREKGLLGLDSGAEATIDPSKIYGLNIRLIGR